MKKLMIAAAVIGLGLGFAKAATMNFNGTTTAGRSFIKAAANTEKKTTVEVCYEVCDTTDGRCYTKCTVTES